MPEWEIISALFLGAVMGGMIYYNSRNSSRLKISEPIKENKLKNFFQRRGPDYKNNPDITSYKRNIGVYPHPSWTYGQIKEANATFKQ